MVRQAPFMNRRIRTLASPAHASNPPADTEPRTTRWRRSEIEIDRWWNVGRTVKVVALVPVPAGVVTLILPVTAPTGTVTLIWVAEFTAKLAPTPPNRTAVAPVKAVPVIVTAVPVLPLVGENEEILGAALVTVKFVALVAVPPDVVTVIRPVVAPDGTFVSIRVPWAFTVNDAAATPLNRTAVAPPKPLPLIRTEVPTGPLVGENEEIVGAAAPGTVKFVALVAVPPGVVTVIFPVTAPLGTIALIRVPAPFTENVPADTPPNVTAVAPVKPVPLIVTEVPTGPLVGENDEIVGADAHEKLTVKSALLVSVPWGETTPILPVVAPVGTAVLMRCPDCTLTEASTPLKVTWVAPWKLFPLTSTFVPTGPHIGVKELMVGPASASAEGRAKRPTRSPARPRHAERRGGSRPAFIRCLPTRAGIEPIVAPKRYPFPVRPRKFDESWWGPSESRTLPGRGWFLEPEGAFPQERAGVRAGPVVQAVETEAAGGRVVATLPVQEIVPRVLPEVVVAGIPVDEVETVLRSSQRSFRPLWAASSARGPATDRWSAGSAPCRRRSSRRRRCFRPPRGRPRRRSSSRRATTRAGTPPGRSSRSGSPRRSRRRSSCRSRWKRRGSIGRMRSSCRRGTRLRSRQRSRCT